MLEKRLGACVYVAYYTRVGVSCQQVCGICGGDFSGVDLPMLAWLDMSLILASSNLIHSVDAFLYNHARFK